MDYKIKESSGTKIGVVEIPIFESVVYIIYEKEAKGWAKHADALTMLNGDHVIEHERLKSDLAQVAGEEVPNKGTCIRLTKMPIILLREEYATTQVVLHECVHAGQSLLTGIDIDDCNREADAYSISYIFKVCKEFLEKEFGVRV